MSFKEELKQLKEKYDEEVKNSKLYKDIEVRIKDICRREAQHGANYCLVSKFKFNDFAPRDYYSPFGPAPSDEFNDMVSRVIVDLGLSRDGTYLTWY